MNGKRYSLIMAPAILAAAIGGASFNRLLVAESSQAQRNHPGQQWEYCSLTQAAYVDSNRGGVFWISYFRDSGVQVVEVADSALEKNGPAKAIARLGAEGWEMVGQGPLEIRQGVWWNWHDNYDAESARDPKWVKVSDAGEAAFRKRDAEAKAS